MLRIFSLTVAFGTLLFIPAAEGTCTVQVEEIDCTNKNQPQLLYTCESKLGDNCSCTFENPLRSEIGWMKICPTKNYPLVRKKKVRKRQVPDQNRCGTISPPKPGKVSCYLSRTEIRCTGTCDKDHEFADGIQKQEYLCEYTDGVWRPDSIFPLCKPKCTPVCENGGICTPGNFCSCTNDFRGNACQYPLSLCRISKNRFASSWKCNHTRTGTMCDISCHPPDSPDAELDAVRHYCTVQGIWEPDLPLCVQVIQCAKPGIIENGWWELAIGYLFNIGSKVFYTCQEHAVLQGERQLVCNESGKWSADPPVCVKQNSFIACPDLGAIADGEQNNTAIIHREGSIVSYKCRDNFTLVGNATLTCLPNGKWSSNKPECVTMENIPVFCPKPNAPRNSVVQVRFPDQHPLSTLFNKHIFISEGLFVFNFSNGQESEFAKIPDDTFIAGTRVQYKCKSHFYKLYGSEYQTCLSYGRWSGYQPACVPECGKSDSPKTPFIVNGNSTNMGQWPWQVGLALKTNRGLQLHCGGVLISELWVLTAAHCVTKKYSNIPMIPHTILIFCGKYYRSFEDDDEYVQVKQVHQVVIPEEYDFVHFDVDLALLQLKEAVELTTRVQPICLPTEETTRENVRDGKQGIVIGWGLTEIGKYAHTLKETTLPVISHDKCEEAYREGLRSITITKNMFCAGYESGETDTCNGDSGGPFMFKMGTSNNIRWYVEGLVSWGSESGCGTALRYSGFTTVGRFVPWIKMIT